MIQEIRQYIKSVIKERDKDLRENISVFYDEDIPEDVLDRTYQIELIQIDSIIREGRFFENNMPVTVSLFGLVPRSDLEQYDCLLDKARCIRDHILKISNFSTVGFITNITSDGIVTRKLSGNDNAFKIDILLNFVQAYSTEE